MDAQKKIIKGILFFLLFILLLPIGILSFIIGQDMIVKKWDLYWLENNLQNKKYEAICIAHSYSIFAKDNVKEIDDYKIPIDRFQLLSADDGIWVIFGILPDQSVDTFNIRRDKVKKYFDNADKQQCKKVGND